MSQVFNVHRSDGWDRYNNSQLVKSIVSLPINHTATITVKNQSNSDEDLIATVFRVLDGWVVQSSVSPEPRWVTLLRNSLAHGAIPASNDF